jgi:hypothetical protein
MKKNNKGPEEKAWDEQLPSIRKNCYSKRIGNMSFKDFIKDVKSSFNFKRAITNKKGNYEEGTMLGYIRPICSRGFDQFRCLMAHWLAWFRTGTTNDYCWQCKHIFRMSGYSSVGVTTECKKGHWRQESS